MERNPIIKKLLLLAILIAGIVSCNNQQIDQKIEAEKIMELSREWAATMPLNDIEKKLSFWAFDAIVFPPGQPAVRGHDAIREMLKANEQIPGFEVSWEPKEAYVSKSGDLAYSIGHNYFSMLDSTGKKITVFNRGVEIWKKQEDGTWKNVVDIFNADPTLTSIK